MSLAHRPASHPVLRRIASQPWPASRVAATEVAAYGDQIDHIALLVAQLPDQDATKPQRLALLAIASELRWRAR